MKQDRFKYYVCERELSNKIDNEHTINKFNVKNKRLQL